MTKYALIYKNDNNENIFCGSFIEKNHHKKRIIFAIREIKTGILFFSIKKTNRVKKIKIS